MANTKSAIKRIRRISRQTAVNRARKSRYRNALKKMNLLIESRKKPEALNLLTIYSELTQNNLEKVISELAGKEYSVLKTKLSDVLISEITPIGKEIKKLLDNKSHLKNILKKGSEKANIIAEENLKNIREKVGLI